MQDKLSNECILLYCIKSVFVTHNIFDHGHYTFKHNSLSLHWSNIILFDDASLDFGDKQEMIVLQMQLYPEQKNVERFLNWQKNDFGEKCT